MGGGYSIYLSLHPIVEVESSRRIYLIESIGGAPILY